ncbi:4-hydroxybenzoate 3-monooxygenase [Rhodoplanes sp. TEM]|uniref:4-hydroxybenzoate 3-monooxygenase n=1 Tax=Rhodoplanes tepidamans TaxID=200616 RepID=A0ABT5J7D7_RHOTP|nr:MULTISPECIES: 4-hydroxybenzoate 3-monooxygenase [Rhodoplanes]MDC7785559.1 4-hydroxybenzoate 3-monooxygenase [Rhodoplanes tepidamans]MDC7985242.1 4-hydroxybenzoate 3-monooxygenase [Rhodoplanes sp. TEM]MDQ0353271.1 p-hydroxybenzoate 3-monooxygenase [Rhodoplanes tepidamans]
MRTKVAIVGAGPAGLMLSLLLRREGIDSVVLEARSRAYVEQRVRAGLLEQWARDLLIEIGAGERLQREGLVHDGIRLACDGRLHSIDFRQLVGRIVTIYDQKEVVKDLIALLLSRGGEILFEAAATALEGLDTATPVVHFHHGGEARSLACDFVAGCDGFHGISRPAIPDGVLTVYERGYPFGWLGILSESPPPSDELIYAFHERGFALFSMRSPTLSRLYLQCEPDEDLGRWPDQRVFDELEARLGGACPLARGPVLQKGVTPMRSVVVEPMQHGRLFLAGDSAHIQPPTGAKGMNLAFADVVYLSRALVAYERDGRTDGLEAYSRTCLDRVWKAQRFSWFMTQLLHRFPDETAFDRRRQRADIGYVAGSVAAATALAENYSGLPLA